MSPASGDTPSSCLIPVMAGYRDVKLKGFDESRSGALNEERNKESFAEITLTVGQVQLKAHKSVLIGFSEYFKAMFTGGMRESVQKEIKLLEVDADCLKILLDCAYTGHIHLTEDNVHKLIETANILVADTIIDECSKFMMEMFSDDDEIIENLLFADHFGILQLTEASLNYIKRTFSKFEWNTQLLSEVSPQHILQIVKSDDLLYEKAGYFPHPDVYEEMIFAFIMRYVSQDKQQRLCLLPDLVKALRLKYLSKTFVKETVGAKLKEVYAGTELEKECKAIMKLFKETRDARPYRLHSRFRKSTFEVAPYPGIEVLAPWDDTVPVEHKHITGITVHIRNWHDITVIGGLEIRYSNKTTTTHGDCLKLSYRYIRTHNFNLDEDERINKVTLRSDWMIDQLKFYTNKGRIFGPYGGIGGEESSCGSGYDDVPTNCYLAAINGDVVDTNWKSSATGLQFIFHWYSKDCEEPLNV